jgi:hypothetical protein
MTITGGEMKAGQRDKVAKRDPMSTKQILRQTGWLKIAQAPLEAAVLVREHLIFQVNITAAAHDIHGAWREGAHDDLVLALALTCWDGPQQYPPGDHGSASRPTIPRTVKDLVPPLFARDVRRFGHGEQAHEADAQHTAHHRAPHDQGSHLPPGEGYHGVLSFPALTLSQKVPSAVICRTHSPGSSLISVAGMDASAAERGLGTGGLTSHTAGTV